MANGAVAALPALTLCTLWTSMSVLREGRVYHWLRPERRPRRWVLIALMQLFALFCIWFPIWITHQRAWLSRILLVLFGTDFFITGITIKWFTPLVDHLVVGRGWKLR